MYLFSLERKHQYRECLPPERRGIWNVQPKELGLVKIQRSLKQTVAFVPRFFPPVFFLFVTEVSWSYFWAGYVPRGEGGRLTSFPPGKRSNGHRSSWRRASWKWRIPTGMAPWTIFFGWQIVVENNPQIPYGTTGVASSFETMETTEGVV